MQRCMDKLRAIKKEIDKSWRVMHQQENMFITEVEDPGELAAREALLNEHLERPQQLNSTIKAAYEAEASFDILKGIRLLNL